MAGRETLTHHAHRDVQTISRGAHIHDERFERPDPQVQVDSPNDRGFFAAAQPIYDRHGQGHVGPPAPKREEADLPIRIALESDRRFERVTLRRYDWDQTYTAAQYRDLMLSDSRRQMMDAQARERLLDDMESFIKAEFADCVLRPLVATMITATRAA